MLVVTSVFRALFAWKATTVSIGGFIPRPTSASFAADSRADCPMQNATGLSLRPWTTPTFVVNGEDRLQPLTISIDVFLRSSSITHQTKVLEEPTWQVAGAWMGATAGRKPLVCQPTPYPMAGPGRTHLDDAEIRSHNHQTFGSDGPSRTAASRMRTCDAGGMRRLGPAKGRSRNEQTLCITMEAPIAAAAPHFGAPGRWPSCMHRFAVCKAVPSMSAVLGIGV